MGRLVTDNRLPWTFAVDVLFKNYFGRATNSRLINKLIWSLLLCPRRSNVSYQKLKANQYWKWMYRLEEPE
jgi:hypothetical protein